MESSLLTADTDNRKRALDANSSFIVQAPAGSGKTELLIQRYLTLLSHVKTPEEILAITFTKKAANEMRVRIVKALQEAALDTPLQSDHQKTTRHIAKAALVKDKEFNWSILQNPNRLRIQTIDALCTALTRQLPVLSQMGANAALTDTPDLIYLETVKEVINYIEANDEWSEAIKVLLLHLDNHIERLYELLINLLKKRDQWLNYIHLDIKSANIRTFLEGELFKVVSEFIDHAKKSFPPLLKKELTALIPYIQNHAQNVFNESNEISYWQDVAALLLTDKGEWRKQFNKNNGFPPSSQFKNPHEKQIADEYKQRMLHFMECIRSEDELLKVLHEVSKLPATTYDENQWQVLAALFDVLKLCAGQLKVLFQQKGQIDFIENAEAANLALGNDENPTDLALALDYQIKHILLDEFQDTSYTQFKLMQKLILGMQADDGRTLFIVGDPMQSIYRFREAEVSLFLSLYENGLPHIQLNPISLRKNFRASPTLVAWCNQEFQMIFPKKNQIALGAVSYTNSIPAKNADSNSTIHINEIIDGNESFQAQKIIELIKTLTAKKEPHSIAILVRARPHLKEIIPQLIAHQIPYQAVAIDPLISKQYIQDILSLAKALLHPEDRLAWLSILRAPWCGLTLSDLTKIAESDRKSAILSRLQESDILAQLSEDGANRLQRILPILQKGIQERYRLHLRYWIESTWQQLGGPATLSQPSEMEDVDCLFKLFEELNTNSEPFNFDKLAIKMAALYAKPLTNTHAIQLMTIHSAKGLEFDTVILPHLEKQPANDQSELLHWMEYPLATNQNALILAPIHATAEDKNPIYQFIARQQKKRSENEINRLLYVAVTRAKQNLYLFYNLKTENDVTTSRHTTFLSKLLPSFTKDRRLITTILGDSIESAPEMKVKNIKRLVSHFQHPHTFIESIPLEKKRLGFKLPNLKKKHIGTVTHLLLQLLAEKGLAFWLEKSNAQQRIYIKAHLQQLNFEASALEEGIQITLGIIDNVLKDPKGQWILQKRQEMAAELAVSFRNELTVEKFVIDRTFIDEEGTRWIIDYKTTAFDQEDLNDFLKQEEEKYREKMLQYACALSAIDQTPIKIGLYFPALPVFHLLS